MRYLHPHLHRPHKTLKSPKEDPSKRDHPQGKIPRNLKRPHKDHRHHPQGDPGQDLKSKVHSTDPQVLYTDPEEPGHPHKDLKDPNKDLHRGLTDPHLHRPMI